MSKGEGRGQLWKKLRKYWQVKLLTGQIIDKLNHWQVKLLPGQIIDSEIIDSEILTRQIIGRSNQQLAAVENNGEQVEGLRGVPSLEVHCAIT